MTHLTSAPRRGTTLLETIIYLGLLSAILAGFILTTYPLFRNAQLNTEAITAESEAAFVLRKIAWALSGASTVTEPAEDDSGDTLTILRVGGGSVSFTQSGGAILLDGEEITNSRIEFANFDVTHTAPSGGTPRLISIEFDADGRHVGPWKKYLTF
jgi:hypothetical protein